MNKVILMGRLTRDPEVRYGNGKDGKPFAIAKYSLAVDRSYKREGQPTTDFINCSALGKSAEFVEKYLKKGHLIVVCGRLEISNYEDKTGQKRTWTEVVVEEHQFAESKQAFEARRSSQQNQDYNGGAVEFNSGASGFMPTEESVDDDDLPF